MRSLSFLLASILWVTTAAAEEPRRLERPHAVTFGVSILQVGGGDVIPYATLQGAWNRSARLALTGEVAFFTSGDRLFGPRLVTRAGARWGFLDGAAGPYLAASAGLYHQWDVEYEYSDRSQVAGTAVSLLASIGHELATRGGFTWVVEASLAHFLHLQGDAPSGGGLHAATTFGYRF